jgi:ATP-dependent DNA ligase
MNNTKKTPETSGEDKLRKEALRERRIRLEDIQEDFEETGKIPLESLVRIASDIADINGFHESDKHPQGIAGIPHMIGLNCSG